MERARIKLLLIILQVVIIIDPISALTCPSTQFLDPVTGNTCQPCPPGFQCDGSNTKTACSSGQFWSLAQCNDCTPGFYCPDSSSTTQLKCPKGFYSASNAVECTPCETNKYCSSTTSNDCPAGQYSFGFSSVCTSCPMGFSCSGAENGNILTPCNVGEYSLTGETSCSSCVDSTNSGFQCSDNGVGIITGQLLQCPDNYFSNTTSNNCWACPAGTECKNLNGPCAGISDCTACPSGKYSSSGGSCVSCPSGYVCQNNGPPVSCELGQYAENNACIDCPPGYYCPKLSITKTKCPPGQRSSPDNNSKAYQCEICPDGFNCENTQVDNGGNVINCADNGNNAGEYCSSGLTHKCPKGSYRPDTSGFAGSVSDCIICPAGSCCDDLGLASPNSCAAGHFCPEGSSFCSENACPAGTFSSSTNLQTAGDCTDCSAGKYCPAGSTSELDCPYGYFCLQNQIGPFENPCPGGTFGASNNLQSKSDCIDCDEGYYCPAGSTSKTACPAGTYNEVSGQGIPDIINCLPCKAGTACDDVPVKSSVVSGVANDNSASACQAGYYCPMGTLAPDQFPCPAGTYSDSTSLTAADECTPCDSGFYCDYGFTSNIMNQYPCRNGYYCPEGSLAETPCPSGFYNDQIKKSDISDCLNCPAGYYCDIATNVNPTYENITSLQCPNGFYCPQNTKKNDEYPCPEGTYNLLTTQTDISDCLDCPLGHYCAQATGDVDDFGVAGVPCPIGTYRDSVGAKNETDCAACTAGYFCDEISGTITPEICPKGYYSDDGSSECTICEEGYYCLNPGTTKTFMETQFCDPGYYCAPGSVQSTGINNEVCQLGRYCNSQVYGPAMQLCPPGTYLDELQQSDIENCKACTAGFWCEEGMIAPPEDDSYGQRFICDAGFYCPTNINVDDTTNTRYDLKMGFPSVIGSTGPNEEPCPAGTYLPTTGGTDVSSCLTCEAGYYCDEGSRAMSTCPAGSYCPEGLSNNPRPCPAGTFSEDIGLKLETDCTICTLGSYCDTEGLTTPSGLCDPGYICREGSTTSQPDEDPTDPNAVGYKCPKGGYCLKGSYQSIACPPRTYNPFEAQMDASNCLFCNAGFYCPPQLNVTTTGLEENGIPCPAGYYCPQGSYYYLPCGAGNYCPQIYDSNGDAIIGSSEPTKCPIGTFQQNDIKGNCDPCPPGQICDAEGLIESKPCPQGSYCPQYNSASTGDEKTIFDASKSHYINITDSEGTFGSSDPSGTLCQPGTYQPYIEQYELNHCLACPAGQYCANFGAAAPTADCLPGYVCFTNSISPTPNDNITDPNTIIYTGRPCSEGNYCPSESILDLACPDGTFLQTTLGAQLSDCNPCPAGQYCPNIGQNSVDDTCDDGYYCQIENSSTDSQQLGIPLGANTPHQYRCDVGTTCTNGLRSVCTSKSYQPYEGANTCLTCPDGKVCPQSSATCSVNGNCVEDCPVGNYCTSGDETECPAGFYSLVLGLSDVRECLSCPGGTFCENASSGDDPLVSQPIEAGYYSSGASTTSKPRDLSDCNECADVSTCNVFCQNNDCNSCGFCPKGSYCEAKTIDYSQTACPPGTFGQSTTQGTNSTCLPCPNGKYCPEPGTTDESSTNPYQDCQAGYICTLGCAVPNPSNITDPNSSCGYVCPEFFYCPSGALSKTLCSDGEESAEGSSVCSPCEDGFTCTVNGDTIDKLPCSEGNYCLAGVEYPCSAGTFNNVTGGFDESKYCLECPPGFYCPQETDQPINCPSGYFCNAGEESDPSQDTNIPQSNICPRNSCCKDGFQKPCYDGFLCETSGIDCDDIVNNPANYQCPAGSYCKDGGEQPCPLGAYCPTGSYQPTYCPSGTINLIDVSQTSNSSCLACDIGSYCFKGITLPDGDHNCHEGYYCDAGSSSAQQNECPEGQKCSNGLIDGCEVGSYNPDKIQTSCIDCSLAPGTFCDSTNMTSINECSAGNYCPDGQNEISCLTQSGTINELTLSYNVTYCQECPLGQSCGSDRTDASYSESCDAGYFCEKGSVAKNDTNNICASGFYCPQGTTSEISCPPGTYSQSTGLQNFTDCINCEIGFYCPGGGLDRIQCPAGQFCESNSETADVECPLGYYCLLGSDKIACPAGTYGERTGLKTQTGSNGCTDCLMGKICNKNNGALTMEELLIDDTYDCPVGFYCQSNSDVCSTTETTSCLDTFSGCCTCPPGFVCPKGSSEPQNCQTLPEYQTSTELGKSYYAINTTTCELCPAGSYCGSNLIEDNCQEGFYCETGTSEDARISKACPKGKYGKKSGGISESDACEECLAGYACPVEGLDSGVTTNQDYQCLEGFYCPTGSLTFEGATISINQNPSRCPAGAECPKASANYTLCTATNYQGLSNQASCSTCPAGYICDSSGMTLIDVKTKPCTEGSYCPAGQSSMNNCGAGKFGSVEQSISSKECSTCKAGYYCENSVNTFEDLINNSQICQAGYVCGPGSSSATASQCPAGTYCTGQNVISIDCPKNYYCDLNSTIFGLDAEPNDVDNGCDAGCYCDGAAASSCPQNCPQGSFCAAATSPELCNAGTYSDQINLQNQSECSDCPAGYICRESGMNLSPVINTSPLISNSESCPAGYFCSSQTSILVNDPSNLCEKGFKCPLGSSAQNQTRCESGQFQSQIGQSTCDSCLAGYYCSAGQGNAVMLSNQPGTYTGNQASLEIPCESGYYNTQNNSIDCQKCPPGKFCGTTGTFDVSDNSTDCQAGFFCQGTSSSSTPSQSTNSGQDAFDWGNGACPRGHYCPAGIKTPTPCPIKTYNPSLFSQDISACLKCSNETICEETGQSAEGTGCRAGYDCSSGSQVPCEEGFYCPGGTEAKQACAVGTYNPNTQKSSISDCLACPAGFYCPSTNTSIPLSCTVGNYCPLRSSTLTPCPTNTLAICNTVQLECPYVCPDGEYSTDGLTCTSCTAGKICDGSSLILDCPNFIPTDVEIEDCPPGRYCNANDFVSQVIGEFCPAGIAVKSFFKFDNCTN